MEATYSAPVQTGPGAHPASCTMGTGSFTGVKSGRGVTLTPHTLLVPWSRKGRAIPLLPLWAVRPVQSLSACSRVRFTLLQCLFKGARYLTSVSVQGALYLTSVPVQRCTLPYRLDYHLRLAFLTRHITFNFSYMSSNDCTESLT